MDSIMKLVEPKSFRFQFSATLLSLYLLTKLSCTFGCTLHWIGSFIVLSFVAWKITKLIQKRYFQESLDSKKKAVLITGCDTGFGHLLAKRLNGLGYTVFAGCLDPNGSNAKDLIKSASNQKSMKLLQMDVTSDADVARVHEEVTKYLASNEQKLWAIVNNAGIATFSYVEWGQLSVTHKIMDVNLIGMVRVTRSFLHLIRGSKGRVINVASMAGRVSSNGLSAYCMSKHGVVAFSGALRREMLPWGVKVSTIEPAFHKTPITDLQRNKENARKVWAETEEGIRKDYGDEYFEANLRLAESHEKDNDDPENVVDAMVHAISAVQPEIQYRVCSWKYAIIWYFEDYMPYSFFDSIVKWVGPKGKPAKA